MKHPLIPVIFALVCLMTLPLGAHAQSADKPPLAVRFAFADMNGDGLLTLTEAQSRMPDIAGSYNSIDRYGSGYITLEQIETYKETHETPLSTNASGFFQFRW